jgi:hypothetical protein
VHASRPTRQEAEAGRWLEHRSSRPAWQHSEAFSKRKKVGGDLNKHFSGEHSTQAIMLPQLEWLLSKIKIKRPDLEKGESYTLLVGMSISAAIMGKSVEIPQKTENMTTT